MSRYRGKCMNNDRQITKPSLIWRSQDMQRIYVGDLITFNYILSSSNNKSHLIASNDSATIKICNKGIYRVDISIDAYCVNYNTCVIIQTDSPTINDLLEPFTSHKINKDGITNISTLIYVTDMCSLSVSTSDTITVQPGCSIIVTLV